MGKNRSLWSDALVKPRSVPGTGEAGDSSDESPGAGKTGAGTIGAGTIGAGAGAGTTGAGGTVPREGCGCCGAAIAAATPSIVAKPSPAVASTARRPNLLLVCVMNITLSACHCPGAPSNESNGQARLTEPRKAHY